MVSKVQPQGLEDIAPAAVTPWAGGTARALGDIFQRTICPDDIKLSSQSDAYGILKARDQVLTGSATAIQLLARTGAQAYEIDETVDFSDCHNMQLLGAGAGPSGRFATSLFWTGAASGTLLKVDSATVQTVGQRFEGFELNGDGLAARCLDTRGVTRALFNRIRLAGATEHQWFLDIGASGLNSQGLGGRSIYIDAYTEPGSNGLWIGDGSATNDTCQSHFEDIQIQFLNGTGLRGGAADTMWFDDTKIYRLAGGTGQAFVAKAGTNGAGFNSWFQGNRFTRFEPRALDGSTTDFVEIQTGTREPQNNLFDMLDQSGPQYPTFKGATASKNTITSEEGYRFVKDRQRWDRDGYVALGANVDEGDMPLTLVQVGSAMLRLLRSDAPADAKRWDVLEDTSGNLIIRTRDDTGANGQLAFVLQRTGAAVTQAQVFIGGAEKLRVSSTGLTAFGLGDYANDAAAAAGGVPVSGVYHNAGALRTRLV